MGLEADGMLHWSDGAVWIRLTEKLDFSHPDWNYLEGHPERERLEREALERVHDSEREKAEKVSFYVGKPHLPASTSGGGWGGPKEGHDKDERFMLRGEARELPD